MASGPIDGGREFDGCIVDSENSCVRSGGKEIEDAIPGDVWLVERNRQSCVGAGAKSGGVSTARTTSKSSELAARTKAASR